MTAGAVCAACVACALLFAVGCGGEGGESRAEDAARVGAERTPDSASLAMADSGPATTDPPADHPAVEDPFGGFDLPSENGTGALRRYRLRLRNDGDSLAIVYADGGAGEILVDSVPAGSWRLVEVDSRARLVRMRSVTRGGALLREAELGIPPDTAVDLDVGPPTAPAE